MGMATSDNQVMSPSWRLPTPAARKARPNQPRSETNRLRYPMKSHHGGSGRPSLATTGSSPASSATGGLTPVILLARPNRRDRCVYVVSATRRWVERSAASRPADGAPSTSRRLARCEDAPCLLLPAGGSITGTRFAAWERSSQRVAAVRGASAAVFVTQFASLCSPLTLSR